MKKIFEDFDFSGFWDDSEYALKEYVSEPPSDELIVSIEEELGYKLPQSYIELMKLHNGGIPYKSCFPTSESTSWSDDHVAITGILGIGREKAYSLGGSLGSKFMIEEWEYPDIGVYICDCPSAGHDIIMLDYRECGRNGEPQVVHIDQESDYRITFLAKDFETFIRGLVSSEEYDDSEEELEIDLNTIESGKFSDMLLDLVFRQQEVDYNTIIRNICRKLTIEKGFFALHADELSWLMYDIQFLLYSKAHTINSKEEYLKVYPAMIALAKGDFSTGGYAPGFIEDWINLRISKQEIARISSVGLRFTPDFEEELLKKLDEYK